jgi:hypothetical protein
MTTSSLIQPALVWLRKGSLDRRLAEGADPAANPALARRALQLSSPRFRAGLASSIRNLIDAAVEPARGPSAAVPLERRQILEERERLLQLADDLESSDRLEPRGLALVERLLTDGNSPIYAPSIEGALSGSLRHARAALYLG